MHGKHLPGKPDIVLPKYETVIFLMQRFIALGWNVLIVWECEV
ncbi:MAG: hypothetical protein LBS42_11710 [Tannerella sp.]|jgi:G:T-mismatch repair DNA endonuclease (very short patch repair protein)|nr:hypothetical protein [Tannerella sp.]